MPQTPSISPASTRTRAVAAPTRAEGLIIDLLLVAGTGTLLVLGLVLILLT